MLLNIRKKVEVLLFSVLAYSSLAVTNWAFWLEKVQDDLKWHKDTWLSETVQNFIIYLLWFLALIWVIWCMYWWFQILTAAWNDEKVKKWKKTILYTLLWLFVIWIAWALVSWTIWALIEATK